MDIIWTFFGTSVRFEPGEEKGVQLTEMGGRQRVFGLNDLTRAQATDDTKSSIHGNCEIKRISVRRDNNEYKNFGSKYAAMWPDYRR